MGVEQFPSVTEVVERVTQRSQRGSVGWSKREYELVTSIRRGLRALTTGSPREALFQVLHGLLPFAGAMIETTQKSRPAEITDTLYCVPDSFIHAVWQHIDDDPLMDFYIRIPAGLACRDTDMIPARTLPRIPFIQALYPHHGFAHLSGQKLSIKPRGDDEEHTCMILLHGVGERMPSWRECRMLELLHDDIQGAVERMRLPLLPHESILFQVMEERRVGYILLRRDGTLLEANQRAYVLINSYVPKEGIRPKAHLVEFAHNVICAATRRARSAYFGLRGDGRMMLELNVHELAKERHAIREDLILIELREIPLAPTQRDGPAPIAPETMKQLLPSLSPREREITILLVTSGLSYKQIAARIGISDGTVRKHVEHIYRSTGVHSRAELTVMLVDLAATP